MEKIQFEMPDGSRKDIEEIHEQMLKETKERKKKKNGKRNVTKNPNKISGLEDSQINGN